MPERYLGRTLGERYQITRLLGAGAHAWVYEAVDVELEIPVAVKVLRPELASNETAQARFRREATTAARLRHPNIVTVRDVGSADGVTWVAMDLLPTSLARRLQVMPYLPETEVVRVGLDVASALAVAHAENVLHRDIKPDNILIGTASEAVLCDFGLARALSGGADLSATNQVLGTPHYFSPEQARGEPLDGRADLYALGVTLYRAATGRLPFEGDDWYNVARQHVESTPPAPTTVVDTISAPFEAIILRLLAKRPEERFASATALADALSLLPSAPATGSRLALQPGGTTTMHTVVSTRGVRGGVLASAAFAIFAAVLLLNSRSQRLTGDDAAAAGVPLVAVDSSARAADSAAADSAAQRVRDSLAADSAPTPVPLNSAGRRPAGRLASLTIRAPDSTVVRLNGRGLGLAPVEEQQLTPGRYVVAATLSGGEGIANCPYSTSSDTIVLAPGDKREQDIQLGRCSVVWLEVTPADARVSFADTTGRIAAQGRADRLSPTVLRAGAWRIQAEARACVNYDGVDTLRAGTDTVRFRIFCPTP